MTAAKSPDGGLFAVKRTFTPALDLGAGSRRAEDCAGEAAALQAVQHVHVVQLHRVVPQVLLGSQQHPERATKWRASVCSPTQSCRDLLAQSWLGANGALCGCRLSSAANASLV